MNAPATELDAPTPRRPFFQSHAFAYIIMSSTMILWASAFAGIRFVLRDLTPETFTFVRLAVASLGFLALATVARVPLPKREDLGDVFGAGLMGFTFYHLALNLGTKHISAGQASFIISTIPIWTAFMAGRFLGERITVNTWLGLGLGMVGIGYISLVDGALDISRGTLFVLAAAISGAGNIIFSKRLLSRYRAMHVSIYSTVAGCLPLLLYTPWAVGELQGLKPLTWAVIAYLGLVPISLGYTLSNLALRILPASRTSQMLLLTPPMAAIIAWLTIGEAPNERLLVGGPLILLGVLLGNSQVRLFGGAKARARA